MRALGLSPDQKSVAAATDGRWILNIADGSTGHVQQSVAGSFEHWGIYLDDKNFLMAANSLAGGNDMASFDITGGNVQYRHTYASDSPVAAAAVSGNGKWAASVTVGGRVHVYDAATGRIVFNGEGDQKRDTALAFSGDSGLLAAGNEEGNIWVWKLPEQVPAPASRPAPPARPVKPVVKPVDNGDGLASKVTDFVKKTEADRGPFLKDHTVLRDDLTALGKAASALAGDAGTDAAKTAELTKAVTDSLASAIGKANEIAGRGSESAANKQKAKQIVAGLKGLGK